MKIWSFMSVIAATAIILAAGAGCRPSRDGETDTTTVFLSDTLAPDTMGTGIWVPETLVTTLDTLIIHQDNLNDVFFDYDKNDLTGAALEALGMNAAYIISHPGFRILLEGHCDERGTIDYNLALGERRALAVYNYLINYGIDASRLERVSYGKERPFSMGSSEEAWAQNRRVHFRALPAR